ncbi:glutamate synthase subunit beta [Solitalea canadensis]|uniref:NADH/NADPH-dependent glutamate synthase small subunit n=1 Tax=Solitalea canadensis (strain ATCC 29591 / DSM 3403 / JCM 21819 / LMG 8368 / NBRC 15130 / NCIMB 12057 / USAM 9D) TaxID=929556 RepID=H8KTK1_SOLCM|nr:glutamate synthase subunit beta [Solitalea canadensis]AFD06459.1 NADH/NADPH-dependent glutamate synthase small subunit [Solitalea canadensis DSM 3403]
MTQNTKDMGKPTGFIEYPREDMQKAPVTERVQHYNEFEKPQSEQRVKTQAARCMGCGIPFCNWGCPVSNLIPEFNDFVYKGQWKNAYGTLMSTNNFPEFTGRVCPAPCEPACTASLVEKPISIKQIELSIIEKAFAEGWVKPNNVPYRTGVKIAVIGSGPAGLSAAQQLNLVGHSVTVFEKNDRLGGLLRYGIPDFKLEKWVIDRRVALMEEEGITFKTNAHVGVTISIDELKAEFDYICLCCGAEKPRGLGNIEGADKKGIYFAMEFLSQQNKENHGDQLHPEVKISAKDKHVVILGGGDTGSDCIGTSIRQGAKSVTQIQIHKALPEERYETNPWPLWPKTFATSSSQAEGCERIFSALTTAVKGGDKIEALELQNILWPEGEIKSGQRNYEISGDKYDIPCDLLLISLGFEHTIHEGLVEYLGLEKDKRGNVKIENYRTSDAQIWAAGDMVEGANLIVTAINSGRQMASTLKKFIKAQQSAI